MIIVEHSPEGQAISDFHVMEFAAEKWAEHVRAESTVDLLVKVSSATVILAFRILVKNGTIPPYKKGVVLRCKDKLIEIDRCGNLSEYPVGWTDPLEDLLHQLL